jgi:hypothetical protein
VDIHMLELDAVFELEDGSILHLEFQTTTRRKDLIRFLQYDVALYQQYGARRIHTVVIYGAGIETAAEAIDAGCFTYTTRTIYLGRQDGEATLRRLQGRVAQGEPLSVDEELDLVFLPLMRQSRPMDSVVREAVGIAKHLPAAAQSSTLAALLGLGFRFLDQTTLDHLVEDLMSTAIGQQLLNQSYQEGQREGEISAMRRSILISLRARFGDLPGSVSAALEGIDTLPRLVTLLERASTVPSLDAFLDALKEEQER